jgi:uncharacterized coiled-coil protein SlyX
VRLTMALDRALTEAMQEIEELHRLYDEQEQVIKDCDDFIAEILIEVDNKETSMTELLMTLRRIRRRFSREMPHRSRRPS